MRKILIAVPCMDQLPAQFAHSLATLTSYGIEDTQISIWFNLGSLIYTSRDQIAKKALLDEADLVMWFDSDMVFNPDTLKRMLKHIDDGHDMVTGIYYRRTQPFSAVLFDKMDLNEEGTAFEWTEFDEIPSQPFEVGACGFGCVLMKTDVFLDVMGKFGKMFEPIGGNGEDASFCMRARECGYKIYCDPSMICGHVGYSVVDDQFFKAFGNKEANNGKC